MFSEDLIKHILSFEIATQFVKKEIKITKKKLPLFHFLEKVNKEQFLIIVNSNKIIKESGTNFQSPAFSQKNVRHVCHTAH